MSLALSALVLGAPMMSRSTSHPMVDGSRPCAGTDCRVTGSSRPIAMPAVLVTAQVPLIIAILTWRFVRSLRRNYELAPFVLTLAVFGLSFVGLGISMYPYLIPNSITLQAAAAPESSQAFMLVGAAVLVPLILAYTAWSYWVFRGKVAHDGYH